MKVILGCDPLLMPLTGIGYYTRNIAKGLIDSPTIEELELFAHGRVYSKSLLENSDSTSLGAEQLKKPPLIKGLRAKLSRSAVAVRCYGHLIPLIERLALRGREEFIFHSPNFLLPNHKGKTIVTIHDISTVKYPQFHPASRVKLVNDSIEKAIDKADHIITDSDFVKAELIDYFDVNTSKVSAIHLGVSPIFKPRNEVECQGLLELFGLNYKSYFLFVSTIEPRKNIRRLLSAFERYRERIPEGKPLILVGGEGWNSKEEHNKIKELELRGWVKFLGYINEYQLPILYSAAHALLFPSLYEGFGLPVAEAIQSGTRVLTSRRSSMEEFSREHAVFVDPLDEDNILEAICILSVLDTSIPAKEFPWDKTMEETLAVYSMVQKY